MGLHRRFRDFFLLGLPIVHSAFSNVVFYLDFDAFFFSFLVPLLGVFPLLINLFNESSPSWGTYFVSY
jgi:hypothetical protein